MAEYSPIGWTDATWPIVAGCEYESPGCSNCWAVRDSWRLAHNPHLAVRSAYAGTVRKTDAGALVWTGLVRPLPERLLWPLQWRKPRKIFVCSQSDLFHPKVPFEFIAAAFGVMAAAHWHTFQVLTKHPARAREFFEWAQNDREGATVCCLWAARQKIGAVNFMRHEPHEPPEWPLENIEFGVTVEDKKRADGRLPHLIKIPAAKRWISYEPALELVDFTDIPFLDGDPRHRQDVLTGKARLYCTGKNGNPDFIAKTLEPLMPHIDQVVFGGESAQTRANTRECDIEWARKTLEACRGAGVAFFMKQGGTNLVTHGCGPVWTAKLDDTGKGYFRVMPPAGKTSRYKFDRLEDLPEDLRVREYSA